MKRISVRLILRRVALATVMAAAIGLLTTSGGNAATRTLITIQDLHWQGTWGFPPVGSTAAGGPGTMAYASGALAVRYVNGQRRFLVPTFTNMNQTTGQVFGDLVEWAAPSDPLYSGNDPSQAPTLVETRRWKDWTIIATTKAWQDPATGVRVGGMYWDEAQGVLWYQLYAYYSGINRPFLAATRLLDTVDSGNYRQVGTKYGPWWYRNNDPSDTSELHWKAVCNWIIPVPPDAQADLKGNKMIIGGTVGAVGGAGNIGPGFRAIPGLPPLSDPPNAVIPLGLRLADYTRDSSQRPQHAHRGTNYNFDNVPVIDSGLVAHNGTFGYWQMSLDQVNSFIWVQTPEKEGILLFGRQATGTTWYGWNPRSKSPYYTGGADATDPTRNIGDTNGYGSSAWRAALYVFDPAQVREVGRGSRSPYSDGINPVAVYDWHARWPNLPVNLYRPDASATQSRPIESIISNSGFWDEKAQEIIWIQPTSVNAPSPRPTLNIFTLGPAAPTNLRIVR
jgi:hypothetical protein